MPFQTKWEKTLTKTDVMYCTANSGVFATPSQWLLPTMLCALVCHIITWDVTGGLDPGSRTVSSVSCQRSVQVQDTGRPSFKCVLSFQCAICALVALAFVGKFAFSTIFPFLISWEPFNENTDFSSLTCSTAIIGGIRQRSVPCSGSLFQSGFFQ